MCALGLERSSESRCRASMLLTPRPGPLPRSNPAPSSVTRTRSQPPRTSMFSSTAWAWACLATFVSASRTTANSSSASRVVDRGVDRSVEADHRIEAEQPRPTRRTARSAPGEPSGRGRRWCAARRSPRARRERCGRGRRPRPEPRRHVLRRHEAHRGSAGSSPMANSRWMTVSCRSRAMRSRSSTVASSATRAWSRAFSMRDAGRRREADGELLVDVGEDLAARLVAQVEVAEHLAAHGDRHTEERRHRRMVRREPEAVGVLAEVGQPQRLRIDDQQPEDAVALREVTDVASRRRRRCRP